MTELFKLKTGAYFVCVNKEENGRTDYVAEGGGFVHSLASEEFHARFERVDPKVLSEMHLGLVYLEEGIKYPAFIKAGRWNGWAMPYFEYSVAVRFMEHSNCAASDCQLNYNVEKDAFVFSCAHDEDEVYPGEDILFDGRLRHVYGIGAGSYCWTEAEGD